jgi:hypothetical protein
MPKSTTSSARRRHAGIAAAPASTGKPLTAAQRQILLAAAARADHAVLPLPTGIPQRGAVPQRLLAALLERRLIAEAPCRDATAAWRTDAKGRRFTLRLTPSGLSNVSADAAEADAEAAEAPSAEAQPAPSATQTEQETERATPAADDLRRAPTAPSGKLGQILAAIGAPQGATLSELIALTGWLPHTTRAALTRLRQRGHAVRLILTADCKSYRLASPASSEASPAFPDASPAGDAADAGAQR